MWHETLRFVPGSTGKRTKPEDETPAGRKLFVWHETLRGVQVSLDKRTKLVKETLAGRKSLLGDQLVGVHS